MRCEHCHNQLLDDSLFCAFCGKSVSLPKEQTNAPPICPAEPISKTRFCNRCGKPVDEESKRCLGCGKQYFRGVPPLIFLCIVLALALVGLMAVCIMQEIDYHARIDELEQLVEFYRTS